MHELAVCQALIVQVEELARSRDARVQEVRIGLGPLSGIEPRLLAQAYPFACAGTLAEGSRLAIEQTQVRVRCSRCGAESIAAPNRLVCGACGDWRTELVAGDEMLLLRLELETPQPAIEAEHV
jgi:hydrogenase nickel incorporation protein HypA/HybF